MLHAFGLPQALGLIFDAAELAALATFLALVAMLARLLGA